MPETQAPRAETPPTSGVSARPGADLFCETHGWVPAQDAGGCRLCDEGEVPHPMDTYPPHVRRLKDLIEATPAYRDNPSVAPDLQDLLSWQASTSASWTARAARLLDLQDLADSCVPQCPNGHGPMALRTRPMTSAEQWCGTWWDCAPGLAQCHSSYLDPSFALALQLESQGSQS